MSIDPTSLPDAPRAGGETPTDLLAARRTNYALALDLLTVAQWIGAHVLRGENIDALLSILNRAVSHLRGQSREPIANLDELLRNDPWVAAIADHVRASLLARQRDGERAQASHVIDTRFINDVRRLYNTTTGVYEFRAAVGECIGNLNEARAKLPPLDGPRIVPSAPSAERA